MNFIKALVVYLYFCQYAMARTLVSTTSLLSKEMKMIGLGLLGASVIFVGYKFLSGKQDAGESLSKAVIGGILISSYPVIVQMVQSIT